MGPAVYILYLPAPPPTIFYRAYNDEADGFTLLGWLLARLRERLAGQELLILCHPGVDEQLAHRHADPLRIPVLTAAAGTRLAALGDLALALAGRPIVAFFPEVAFAPPGILAAVLAHHVQANNHYTAVKGLPYGVAPEVFDAALLAGLARVAFDGPAPDLTLAVQQLLQNRPGELRGVPYTVPEVPGFAEIPVLSIETALDVRRARHCLLGEPEVPLAHWLGAEASFAPPHWPDPEPDVLYISPWSGYGGAEECLRWLAAGLARKGLRQAALLGVEDVLAERMREAGVQVYCANWQFERDTPAAREFTAQALDSLRPRLIHCNTDPGPLLFPAAAARGIPVVTHIRMPQLEAYGNAMAHSTRLIAVSDYVRELLLAEGVHPSRVERIYDGVDAARFQPGVLDRAAMRRAFGFGEQDFLVLMVARQVPEKRHDLLLRAAAEARAALPNLRIAFVGNQGRAQYQRQLALLERELGVSDIVRWFPFQADIRRIECAADTLVLCSDREALGTCVLETLALGIPVIVSDGYGPKEMVAPGVSGLLVKQGSATELRDAIVALAADPASRAAMGVAARQEFLRRFTLDGHADQVAALFRQLSR